MFGLLCLLSVARAGGPEVWAALYDGRLTEAADRDPAAAQAIYEAVLNHLAEDDAIRGELLYWLAWADFHNGQYDAAREALQGASTDPRVRSRSREFLGRLTALQREISTLPYVDDFTSGTLRWVRGWTNGVEDDLKISDAGDSHGAALTWKVRVREGQDDFIMLPFGDLSASGGPTRFALSLKAEGFPAQIRPLLEDRDGRLWAAPVVSTATDRWVQVDLGLSDFVGGNAASLLRHPAAPRVSALWLRDVTAFRSTLRGDHSVLVDDVEVR